MREARGAHNDDGHAHLRFLRLPAHAPHVAIWAASASLATLAVLALGSAAFRICAALRVARRLLRAIGEVTGGLRVVDDELVFCGAVGLLRPQIVIS